MGELIDLPPPPPNGICLKAAMRSDSKVFAASSLWCTYSKLKTILRVREKVDVSSFTNVVSFLKKMSVRHVPRKSNVLSRSQIDEFLLNVPDDVFLLIKVVTAFGVFGAYRRQELHDLCFNDVKVEGSVLVVRIAQTKNYKPRTFTIVPDGVGHLIQGRCLAGGKPVTPFRLPLPSSLDPSTSPPYCLPFRHYTDHTCKIRHIKRDTSQMLTRKKFEINQINCKSTGFINDTTIRTFFAYYMQHVNFNCISEEDTDNDQLSLELRPYFLEERTNETRPTMSKGVSPRPPELRSIVCRPLADRQDTYGACKRKLKCLKAKNHNYDIRLVGEVVNRI
ncbi:hypothetical protein C0J52_17646 [Blattella germanica]|nr:hypothetical protein C0J52_17646 [Blattella germanica]